MSEKRKDLSCRIIIKILAFQLRNSDACFAQDSTLSIKYISETHFGFTLYVIGKPFTLVAYGKAHFLRIFTPFSYMNYHLHLRYVIVAHGRTMFNENPHLLLRTVDHFF